MVDKKYPMQLCQDDNLTRKFRELHKELVNKIISFCKENNISINEFHLNADGVDGSIPYGEWEACTDSGFSMIKYNKKFESENFLFSV